MSIDYEFRSLEQWPGERTRSRQKSRFDSLFSATQDLLDSELKHLAAKNVVIQADCDRSEIRLDGRFRANAKMRGPGVILSFDSKHGPLSYPCDKFTTWQDNLRAIALSLEALRKVDRYGVTKRAEQYKGWEKLPPAPNQVATSVEAAAQVLAEIGGGGRNVILGSREEMLGSYRRAVLATHPDRYPGLVDSFKKVQEAKEVLDRHFGVAS